ncbi:MAG: hypothetical protein ACRC2U_01295, partial [Aeromonas sp.]
MSIKKTFIWVLTFPIFWVILNISRAPLHAPTHYTKGFNVMYTPTNPFIIAYYALTAPNARAYYAMRAQQDVGLVIWAVATAATAVYSLGYEVADALRVAVVDAQPEPAEVLALPVSLDAMAQVAMDVWAAARN